jgi:hypothetical protein
MSYFFPHIPPISHDISMKVEIREVTTMYCKNKSKLTRELRHKLESELLKNIMVRDNQSEENEIFQYPLPFSDTPDRKVKPTL